MFNVVMILFVAVLFVLLTPGVLLSLPPGGTPLVMAIVHGLVFSVVCSLAYPIVAKAAGVKMSSD
jgi:hypothetical protein